jgi:two-component system sensor histidine kinase/response regulator
MVTNFDSAIKYKNLQLELATSTQNHEAIALCIRDLGNCYWKMGKTSEAYLKYLEAKDYSISHQDTFGIGAAMNNIGLIHYDFANYQLAVEYFIEALKVFESLGNKRTIAIVSNNIGTIFKELKDYEQSINYTNQAYALNKEMNSKKGMASNLLNLGVTHDELKHYDTAIYYYEKSLELRKETDDLLGQAKCLTNLASSYGSLKQYERSMNLFKSSIALYKELNVDDRNVHNYSNIGLIYRETGNFKMAIDYQLKAFNNAKRLNLRKLIEASANKLAEAYHSNNQHKLAGDYFQIALEYKDSLYDENQRVNINKLELKHKFEKELQQNELIRVEEEFSHKVELEKQKSFLNFAIAGFIIVFSLLILIGYHYNHKKKVNKQLMAKNAEISNQSEEINLQNEMLIARNEKITQQNEQIDKLSKSKDKIFSVIGHDLRNAIGTTANSLSYLLGKKSSLDGKNTQMLLSELRDDSTRTYTLLENLLSWGKSQMSGVKVKPVQFDITEPILETVRFLNIIAQKKDISVLTSFEEKTMVFADPESIKMIVRNLISNAIKFTENDGKIEVSASEKDGKMKISVKDNGVGISEEALQ